MYLLNEETSTQEQRTGFNSRSQTRNTCLKWRRPVLPAFGSEVKRKAVSLSLPFLRFCVSFRVSFPMPFVQPDSCLETSDGASSMSSLCRNSSASPSHSLFCCQYSFDLLTLKTLRYHRNLPSLFPHHLTFSQHKSSSENGC